MPTHMNEKPRILERVKDIAGVGLVALALSACAPPSEYSYYEPFTDTIVYNTPHPSEATIIHEETHKKRANEHPQGRLIWGLKYALIPEFACEEESHARLADGSEDIFAHPACDPYQNP